MGAWIKTFNFFEGTPTLTWFEFSVVDLYALIFPFLKILGKVRTCTRWAKDLLNSLVLHSWIKQCMFLFLAEPILSWSKWEIRCNVSNILILLEGVAKDAVKCFALIAHSDMYLWNYWYHYHCNKFFLWNMAQICNHSINSF